MMHSYARGDYDFEDNMYDRPTRPCRRSSMRRLTNHGAQTMHESRFPRRRRSVRSYHSASDDGRGAPSDDEEVYYDSMDGDIRPQWHRPRSGLTQSYSSSSGTPGDDAMPTPPIYTAYRRPSMAGLERRRTVQVPPSGPRPFYYESTAHDPPPVMMDPHAMGYGMPWQYPMHHPMVHPSNLMPSGPPPPPPLPMQMAMPTKLPMGMPMGMPLPNYFSLAQLGSTQHHPSQSALATPMSLLPTMTQAVMQPPLSMPEQMRPMSIPTQVLAPSDPSADALVAMAAASEPRPPAPVLPMQLAPPPVVPAPPPPPPPAPISIPAPAPVPAPVAIPAPVPAPVPVMAMMSQPMLESQPAEVLPPASIMMPTPSIMPAEPVRPPLVRSISLGGTGPYGNQPSFLGNMFVPRAAPRPPPQLIPMEEAYLSARQSRKLHKFRQRELIWCFQIEGSNQWTAFNNSQQRELDAALERGGYAIFGKMMLAPHLKNGVYHPSFLSRKAIPVRLKLLPPTSFLIPTEDQSIPKTPSMMSAAMSRLWGNLFHPRSHPMPQVQHSQPLPSPQLEPQPQPQSEPEHEQEPE